MRGDRRRGNRTEITHATSGTTEFGKPCDFVGTKTFGSVTQYEQYARSFIHDIKIPGCTRIEDGSVESDSTTLVSFEAGYRFTDRLALSAALFSVFDARDNDITYFHESRLAGEASPVEDIHFHPVEPRTVRVTLRATF